MKGMPTLWTRTMLESFLHPLTLYFIPVLRSYEPENMPTESPWLVSVPTKPFSLIHQVAELQDFS